MGPVGETFGITMGALLLSFFRPLFYFTKPAYTIDTPVTFVSSPQMKSHCTHNCTPVLLSLERNESRQLRAYATVMCWEERWGGQVFDCVYRQVVKGTRIMAYMEEISKKLLRPCWSATNEIVIDEDRCYTGSCSGSARAQDQIR